MLARDKVLNAADKVRPPVETLKPPKRGGAY
jgi:hypothetical protein